MGRLRDSITPLLLAAAALCLSPQFVAAQVTEQQVRDVLKNYESTEGNKTLLRGFWTGEKLQFDPEGAVIEGQPGIWTVDGWIRIEKVTLKKGALKLRAQRLAVIFSNGKEMLYNHPDRECTLTLPVPQDQAGLEKLLSNVFFRTEESFLPALPDIWQKYLISVGKPTVKPDPDRLQKAPELKEDGGIQFYTVGKGMKPPRGASTPDPSYNPVAKAAKLQGTVVLWVIVGPDDKAHAIRLQRPLGAGLDEAAVAAVEQWRFEPAKYQGKPVPVQVNIEVNFRLY